LVTTGCADGADPIDGRRQRRDRVAGEEFWRMLPRDVDRLDETMEPVGLVRPDAGFQPVGLAIVGDVDR
jgi:hypothetical protein